MWHPQDFLLQHVSWNYFDNNNSFNFLSKNILLVLLSLLSYLCILKLEIEWYFLAKVFVKTMSNCQGNQNPVQTATVTVPVPFRMHYFGHKIMVRPRTYLFFVFSSYNYCLYPNQIIIFQTTGKKDFWPLSSFSSRERLLHTYP